MPILHDFCQALQQAIDQYETEWQGKMSVERQNQIADLRVYLNQCQNPNQAINALMVRQSMMERIENLSFEFFEFLLGTRLTEALKKVLRLFRFSDVQLMIAQCAEMQNTHQAQIQEKNTQITTLTNEVNQLTQQVNALLEALKQESAKDSVQKVNQLTQALLTERENVAYLTSLNEKLMQSLEDAVDLKIKYETLLTDHQALQEKYDALLAEQEKASTHSQNKKSTPDFSPSLN